MSDIQENPATPPAPKPPRWSVTTVQGLTYILGWLKVGFTSPVGMTKEKAFKAWQALKRVLLTEQRGIAIISKAEGELAKEKADADAKRAEAIGKLMKDQADAEYRLAEADQLRAKAARERAETALLSQVVEIRDRLVDSIIDEKNGAAGAIIYDDSHLRVQIGRGVAKPKASKRIPAETGQAPLALPHESKPVVDGKNGENGQPELPLQ